MLRVDGLEVRYGSGPAVLRELSLHVAPDEIVALLGANGAGKTTLLRAITGLLPLHRGRIARGSIAFGSARLDGADPAAIVRAGIAQVMEGRRIFPDLTVEENLRVGGFVQGDGRETRAAIDRMLTLFPILATRRRVAAGLLSGGEQQMVAIARALMSQPSLLLLDEPSLGIAPLFVEKVRQTVVEINGGGTAVLLIEQNAALALGIAHRAYVLEHGSVVQSGSAVEVAADGRIRQFYLGIGAEGRRSFRHLKC
jgi:branched-chain amino acid transport system ATP-binding protein